MPPFTAVRAFEASARYLSFKKAAAELCLTQSAVSHQVKALEDYLGVQLFYRETRGVVLTDEGTSYLDGLTGILDRMAVETDRIRNRQAAGPLSVRTTPGFANRWLMPRLASFYDAYPYIDLHLSASVEPVDFATEDVDISIRFECGSCKPSPGLRVDPLVTATRFPVAGTSLLREGPPIAEPADLRHHTLLHDEVGNDWQRWLALAGVHLVNADRGPRFQHCDLLLQAASEGQGVALAFDCLVDADLAHGRLVRLFDLCLPPGIFYSVVTPRSWADRPRIAAFRSWLLKEAEADRELRHLPTPVAVGERMVSSE